MHCIFCLKCLILIRTFVASYKTPTSHREVKGLGRGLRAPSKVVSAYIHKVLKGIGTHQAQGLKAEVLLVLFSREKVRGQSSVKQNF